MLCKFLIISAMELMATVSTLPSSSATYVIAQRDVVPRGTADTSLTLGPWAHATLESDLVVRPSPDVNTEVVVAAVQSLGQITQAVCSSGSVFGCVAVGVTATFVAAATIFFGIFNKRDLSGSDVQMEYLPGFEPTSSCGPYCTLKASVPTDGTVTHFGYVTINGTLHSMHFAHGGSTSSGFSMLRSVQHGPASASRLRARQSETEELNDGGVVSDYHFSDVNLGIWDEFHADPNGWGNAGGNLVAQQLFAANTLVACANFEDGSPGIDGVVGVGWNNQPFIFGAGSAPPVSNVFHACGF